MYGLLCLLHDDVLNYWTIARFKLLIEISEYMLWNFKFEIQVS